MSRSHNFWLPLSVSIFITLLRKYSRNTLLHVIFQNQIKYTSLIPNTKTEGQFRNTVWDPFLLISQIIALQCVYYLTLGLWLAFICFMIGTSRSLDHIFRFQVRETTSMTISFLLFLTIYVLGNSRSRLPWQTYHRRISPECVHCVSFLIK